MITVNPSIAASVVGGLLRFPSAACSGRTRRCRRARRRAAAHGGARGQNGCSCWRTHRVLRLVAQYGVFEYTDGVVAHTPSSRLLRQDHPQSMRWLVRMFGLPGLWATVGELTSAVRTGEPSADRALRGGIWGYLKENPDASRIFGEAMTGKAQGHIAAFSRSTTFPTSA